MKDNQVFNCFPELELRFLMTVEDEVNTLLWHQLIIQVHWTKANTGVLVKDLNSEGWLACNEKVALTVPQHSLNNTTSYILFYEKN